jgi:hypothetical protein
LISDIKGRTLMESAEKNVWRYRRETNRRVEKIAYGEVLYEGG